ncbi:pentachlorophenol 4-monooxygenase [Panaeolus papilionaceus]|nr:pentachlorophenol 4-monooxygenase [Panaeolus papilionaceus]
MVRNSSDSSGSALIYAYHLQPRSLELFTYLRIIEDVMKSAILTPTVRMYKMPEGVQPSHEFEMSPHRHPTPTNPFLNPVMLGQDKLEKIFHAALARFGCFVELGTELQGLQNLGDRVRVHLLRRGFSLDPNAGTPETSEYEWVIGADGARGVVRNLLGLAFHGERKVENFIVGDICVENLSQKYWHMWGDASDVLISLRATETPKLFNFVIGGKNIVHRELTNNEEALKRCFKEHTGTRNNLKFGDIPWMSHYTPNIRMVETFGHGRVYVAGDAGHVHSPTGGQGMNTGIQDSFNLGWKLALIVKGVAHPQLLQSYTDERIPVIEEMINQTTKLLKRTLENDDEAWKTSGSLFQLGINYRWSPIVVDERHAIEAEREAAEDAYLDEFGCDDDDEGEAGEVKVDSYGADHDGKLQAGDRAPDSSGLVIHHPTNAMKQNCQLFQIFDAAHHTVLLFAEITDVKGVLRALAVYPPSLIRSVVVVRSKKQISSEASNANIILEDKDGHAHAAYCPTGMCGVVVVRPDGIVGAIAKGSLWLDRYFRGVFTAL